MGGEWWFNFLGDKNKFDLTKYQNELKEIKRKYQGKMEQVINNPRNAVMAHGYDRRGNMTADHYALPKPHYQVYWFQETATKKTPDDNIYARFLYKCNKTHVRNYEWHNGTGMAGWVLYWDPTIVAKPESDVHARCSQYDFTKASVDIQKEICHHFPDHFQLWLGDGITGFDDSSEDEEGELGYFGVIPDHIKLKGWKERHKLEELSIFDYD